MSQNTVMNIYLMDGELIALNEIIQATVPVAAQPSAIDKVAKPLTDGFTTGKVMKKIKRTQTESVAAATRGSIGGFIGASSQELHYVETTKTYREDNIVFNQADITKLQEGKGGNIVGLEAGDFLVTGRELDLKELILDLKTKATANLLHTAFDATGAPSGAQPAASGTTLAANLNDIAAGLRVVASTELDSTNGGRLSLIREAVQYLNSLGTPSNTEEDYLFSINGHSLDTIKVLARYTDIVKIKDNQTINFVNVSGTVMRNISGLVGYIDNLIEIINTNQMPAETRYIVMTDRVFSRTLDWTAQFIGKVRDAATVVMKDATTKNLKPNELLLQFYQGRAWATVYPEEAFFIDAA